MFAEKYKSISTNSEYDILTKQCQKVSIFYILPKLHKTKEINQIVEIKPTEYIQIDEDILIKVDQL